jgi:hypothetical protein
MKDDIDNASVINIMADTTILIAVTWDKKPFVLGSSYSGTVSAICDAARDGGDCMLECNRYEFGELLNIVAERKFKSEHKFKKEFHDRYHGCLVVAKDDVHKLLPCNRKIFDCESDKNYEDIVSYYVYVKYGVVAHGL